MFTRELLPLLFILRTIRDRDFRNVTMKNYDDQFAGFPTIADGGSLKSNVYVRQKLKYYPPTLAMLN
jgi:hypothetical protein